MVRGLLYVVAIISMYCYVVYCLKYIFYYFWSMISTYGFFCTARFNVPCFIDLFLYLRDILFFNCIVIFTSEFWNFLSTTFFFVLKEKFDSEFIFQSEEEEYFVGYEEELDSSELSVSWKGSFSFGGIPGIFRVGYFVAIRSILLFVILSCCLPKLLLLIFLLCIFILLPVLSNLF